MFATKNRHNIMRKEIVLTILASLVLSTVAMAQEDVAEQEEAKAMPTVGDVYTFADGSQGVVFYTDGEHGLAVSMKGTEGKWCSGKFAKKDIYDLPNRCDADPVLKQIGEGAAYSESMLEAVQSPIVAWCYSLGQGWYLPSANELSHLLYFANDSKVHGGVISKSLRKNGGHALQKGWYWSSTECSRDRAVNVSEEGDASTEEKTTKNLVRAVREF